MMIPPYIAQAIQCLRSVVSMACGQASGIRNAEVRAKSSSGIPAAFSKKAMASASWMGTDWQPTDHQLKSASAMGVNRNTPSGISSAMRSPHSVRSARSSARPASAWSSTSVPAHRPQS